MKRDLERVAEEWRVKRDLERGGEEWRVKRPGESGRRMESKETWREWEKNGE